MEALLCCALLLAMLVAVALRTLTPVIASVSAPPNQANFSNHPKTPSNRAATVDFDTTGSIESRWDSGSFWDEEAPDYDLTQSAH
jgi:hypothetical protein